MSSAPDLGEVVLARKILRVLDAGTADVPERTLSRLAIARETALARKKPDAVISRVPVLRPALAGAPGMTMPGPATGEGRRSRMQWWLPLTVLVISLAGIVHWEDQRRVAELASIDAQVLSDALPIDAYLDHGFNEYLARHP